MPKEKSKVKGKGKKKAKKSKKTVVKQKVVVNTPSVLSPVIEDTSLDFGDELDDDGFDDYLDPNEPF